jgi:DeoR family suf operon transcriptional repressor
LDILEHDGLVDHSEVRKPTCRPQYSFHLTEKGHDSVPKDYSRLLNELVSDIKSTSTGELGAQTGDQILRESLARVGERRAFEYAQIRRPVEVVKAVFEDSGYDPVLEIDEAGLEIRVTNCPYRRASIDDEITCRVDRSMIKHFLGDKVQHSVEMSPETNERGYMLSADQIVNIDSLAAGD